MGGKRKRLSAMVQIDIDSNQSKANRFNRYSILKSKKKEGQNNRPPILEAPGCHVQPLQSPLVIEMPSHEKFKTSNVNNEGAFQTVGVRRNLSGGLAQSSQCNFRIGSQIFSNEPTASSSTNPSDSVIDTAQCPTKFNGTDINVSDHPNITVGDEQLSQYIPPVSHIRRHYESHTFGGPNITCPFCGAKMWNEERVVVSPRVNYPVFSMCCKQGTIRLPLQHSTPAFLDQLFHPQSGSLYQHFKDNIRVYNSLFQFTSLGGKIDASINNGNGPYIFRLNGQTHHRLGSLLPLPGHNARYAQLHIYDTANEVSNCIYSVFGDTAVENINAVIVEGILGMLNEFNVIAKAFRMARDRYEEEGSTPWRLRWLSAREPNKKNYADPSGSEIAALIVGDIGVGNGDRDVIVEHRNEGLKRISVLHPLYMSMQYPLLFPHGEDGYVLGIPFVSSPVKENLKRKTVSMREYYAWKIQTRDLLHNTLLRGGRLFQQFLTNAFSATDEERLHYIKNNQRKLRAEMYKDIRDAMHRGDVRGKSIGKRFILPASFTGSSRYLFQNYQDALAICRYYGLPDLFITFTCNANWSEIQEAIQILRGQKAEDRPDIVARVFKIKLAHLLNDLMKEAHFGKASAVTYTIEFQKRGLPHLHILIWLQPSAKFKTAADIDRFVSVEIPDSVNDPIGYEAVTSFMIHGPCGPVNYNASCMLDKKCTKFFPKSFQAQTLIDEHGYAVYRRRDTGPDRARLVIERDGVNEKNEVQQVGDGDEIQAYLDCRYLSAYEAAWRLFMFPIHHREPAILRLAIHLPEQQNIYFDDDEPLHSVLSRPNVQRTMFTEWMVANQRYESARELLYSDFPTKFVWHKDKMEWRPRANDRCIGRLIYINPAAGELYYLRLLSNVVRGARSFDEIMTVNGKIFRTFQEACEAHGLLGDDEEWNDALKQASTWATSKQLRDLFVTIILFREVRSPKELFEGNWRSMSDDIEYQFRRALNLEKFSMPENDLKNYVLIALEELFVQNCTSLAEKRLPQPTGDLSAPNANRLIFEELSYNLRELQQNHIQMLATLNPEQREIYSVIKQSVDKNEGRIFFISGHGGTGKTYLWKTIIAGIRSNKKIVLVVASSGIASLLLPGGRTAHSRFKVPINIDEWSTCEINKSTQLASLLKQTSLIIWDEAPMVNQFFIEALDKSLKDIFGDSLLQGTSTAFGGRIVVFGGDFRQILPVIPSGTKADILNATMCNSQIWHECEVYTLKLNMRLMQPHMDDHRRDELNQFAQWLLNIGDRKISSTVKNNVEDGDWIVIPNDFLINEIGDPLDIIFRAIYIDFEQKFSDPLYLRQRAIVTPHNDVVDQINSYILEMMPGPLKTYHSCDTLSKSSFGSSNQEMLYPPEVLNTINFPGVPSYVLNLKIGVTVMLLRNIRQINGLCNGTRLLITQLESNIIEATIITGEHLGEKVFIPKIVFTVKDKKWPFIFNRRQFPLRLSYAMTINKSQGQTLDIVGVYLPKPIFTHGQLYVAFSRVSSKNGLRILIHDEN